MTIRPFVEYPTTPNPDINAIQTEDTINIEVSLADITASNATQSVALNSRNTEITVYIDSTETSGSLYYTPMYTEVINYDIWKKTINKSFTELSAL